MPQTTIQNTAAIRKGSVRVQIGDDFSSLVDVGALRNPVFTSLVENQAIVFDNVDDLKKFVNGQKVQVSFDLAEINFTNLAVLDSGLISVSSVAAAPVAGAVQTIASGALATKTWIAITNQNSDLGAITINSISGSVDGAITEAADDWEQVIGSDGRRGIVFNVTEGTALTTMDQIFTINYDYTPAASKTVTFTDMGTKTLKVMRLINTDENSDDFKIDIEDGTNFTPLSIDFAGDDEEDVAILPIQFQGTIVEIVDEQQTT